MIIPAVLKPFAIPSTYFSPEEHLKSSVHTHQTKRTAVVEIYILLLESWNPDSDVCNQPTK